MHASEKSLKLVLNGLKVAIVLGVLAFVSGLVLYGLSYEGFITWQSYETSRLSAIGRFEEAKAKGKLKKGFVYIGPEEPNTHDNPNPDFIWHPQPPAGFYYVVSVDRHTLEIRLRMKNEGVLDYEPVPLCDTVAILC